MRTPFGIPLTATRFRCPFEWRSNVPVATVVNVVPLVDTCTTYAASDESARL